MFTVLPITIKQSEIFMLTNGVGESNYQIKHHNSGQPAWRPTSVLPAPSPNLSSMSALATDVGSSFCSPWTPRGESCHRHARRFPNKVQILRNAGWLLAAQPLPTPEPRNTLVSPGVRAECPAPTHGGGNVTLLFCFIYLHIFINFMLFKTKQNRFLSYLFYALFNVGRKICVYF